MSVERLKTPDELAREATQRAYNAAIRLLASRDHSVVELTRKLQQREHAKAAIDEALEELIETNYVNDTRYAALYAEQRMNHGYGPLSIRSKLATRGIAGHLVQSALQALDINWADHAESVIERRFSAYEIADTGQQATARIARFLQQRGFSSGDALRALKQSRSALNRAS